ncbi:hypothetical protein LMG29542_07704 [Paraburkholderia humisilvae]|uniref:Uncharacterized protein n=1 Tax=Paraburkholderia humisilvae TaxID=627669 RepID=A0A6J5F682_9BURK|nr:hypothetical protein LMG29542_07704 [Paraburkholderia humisilvae]
MARLHRAVSGKRLIIVAGAFRERADAPVERIGIRAARQRAQKGETVVGTAEVFEGRGHVVDELQIAGRRARLMDQRGQIRFVVVEHGGDAQHVLPADRVVRQLCVVEPRLQRARWVAIPFGGLREAFDPQHRMRVALHLLRGDLFGARQIAGFDERVEDNIGDIGI